LSMGLVHARGGRPRSFSYKAILGVDRQPLDMAIEGQGSFRCCCQLVKPPTRACGAFHMTLRAISLPLRRNPLQPANQRFQLEPTSGPPRRRRGNPRVSVYARRANLGQAVVPFNLSCSNSAVLGVKHVGQELFLATTAVWSSCVRHSWRHGRLGQIGRVSESVEHSVVDELST